MALKGTYSTEDFKSMASVSIRDDHALVTVYTYPDGENMMYWEMDAVLQDGSKLIYDRESVSHRVVDESSGAADLEPDPDGGTGYVEILSDGSLSFAGAYSAELQELVLPRVA